MNNKLSYDDILEIELELTGQCNLQCYVCSRNFYHSQFMSKVKIRPIINITEQLDKFKNLKKVFLAGTVSEPTLYPYFFELIHYLNKRRIVYDIFSNGNTHNKQWWSQLGKFLTCGSRVIFTICGSTQELHEKYRVGSNLQQILDHAAAFRSLSNNRNDICQFILFEYNEFDLMKNMNKIFDLFSGKLIVTAEYRRRIDDKKISPPHGIVPPKKIKIPLDYIYSNYQPLKSKIKINCRSFNYKKIYIDQFGKIFPCFTMAEFEQKKFTDFRFNYSDILCYSYIDCWLCSEQVDKILKPFNIDIAC